MGSLSRLAPGIVIPTDALVLVTDGTQQVPLHVIKLLLESGCRVRAATPWMEDASWLDQLFLRETMQRRFERISLGPGHPTDKSFYRDAVKGVQAVVHSATFPGYGQSREDSWTITTDSVLCMLEAAENEKSMRSFVYTSALVAAAPPVSPTDISVNEDSWNVHDSIMALTGSCDPHIIYNSSMATAEQALWHWAREQCPSFKINVVSPSSVIGANFGWPYHNYWRNWIWHLYKYGHARPFIPGAGPTQAHWYVDVEDVALLHVAAVFDPTVSAERLQAWGCYRNFNDVIQILRDLPKSERLYDYIDDDGLKRGQQYSAFSRVLEIFERWKGKGQGRWKRFEDTVRESLETFQKESNRQRAAEGL